jgi:hypothetical protein
MGGSLDGQCRDCRVSGHARKGLFNILLLLQRICTRCEDSFILYDTITVFPIKFPLPRMFSECSPHKGTCFSFSSYNSLTHRVTVGIHECRGMFFLGSVEGNGNLNGEQLGGSTRLPTGQTKGLPGHNTCSSEEPPEELYVKLVLLQVPTK